MTNHEKCEAVLKRWKRPMRTSEVAQWARLTSAAASGALQKLVKRGIVRRVDNGDEPRGAGLYELIGEQQCW